MHTKMEEQIKAGDHETLRYSMEMDSPLLGPSEERNIKNWQTTKTVLYAACGLLVFNIALSGALVAKVFSSGSNENRYINAGCSAQCSAVCLSEDCFPSCYKSCAAPSDNKRPALLGEWIKLNAIQHVGISTSNLTRSVHFFTEVMGGVEVNYAGGDGWKDNDVYQLLMQQALLDGTQTAGWAANITKAG
jgi:hypothetical protein